MGLISACFPVIHDSNIDKPEGDDKRQPEHRTSSVSDMTRKWERMSVDKSAESEKRRPSESSKRIAEEKSQENVLTDKSVSRDAELQEENNGEPQEEHSNAELTKENI